MIELPVEQHVEFARRMQDALALAKEKDQLCVVVLKDDGFDIGTAHEYGFDDWDIIGKCYPGGRAVALCTFEDRSKP